jgi:putative transposase
MFGPAYANRLRRRGPRARITGMIHYLWRAVDQHGNVLDILVQPLRMPKQPNGSSANCSRACGTCRG